MDFDDGQLYAVVISSDGNILQNLLEKRMLAPAWSY
jgi:hypothetical protein